MVKIDYISDIHFECYEYPLEFQQKILKTKNLESTILILAGDIVNLKNLENTKKIFLNFCNEYEDVIYILGNHEFYHDNWDNIISNAYELEKLFENLHFLNNSNKIIQGINIYGGTLWFPEDPLNEVYSHMLSDYRYIKDFRKNVYLSNQLFLQNLEQFQGSLVISHHLPSYQSVADEYKGSPLNRFFACELTNIIKNLHPLFWIHGHTHHPCNYEILSDCQKYDTRVLANPLGYPREFSSFKEIKTFEIKI